MGVSKEFRCHRCGYSAVVVGGIDAGMAVIAETHVCSDCLILTDVIVAGIGHEDPEKWVRELDREQYACTKCGGNNLAVWDIEKRPCPGCGEKMTEAEGIVLIWD